MSIQFIGDQILFDGDDVAMDPDCCCDTVCPCCYYAIQILRDDGTPFAVRQMITGFCALGPDTTANPFQCGDETFVLELDTISPPEGCVCYGDFSSDTNAYSVLACSQQYYTESSQDDVCNYTRSGKPGVERHTGTMSFRHVYNVTFCYDPCGTATVSINHKVYCNFGVLIHDEPPPAFPVTDTWVDISTELIYDSTWTWTSVTTTNCTTNPDVGTTTSSSLASTDFTKTWGTTFINAAYGCSTPSSFTVVIPKPCPATGLILIGGGTPCECGDPPASPEGYFADGYFADGYFSSGYFTESTAGGTYSGYFADGYFTDGYFEDNYL